MMHLVFLSISLLLVIAMFDAKFGSLLMEKISSDESTSQTLLKYVVGNDERFRVYHVFLVILHTPAAIVGWCIRSTIKIFTKPLFDVRWKRTEKIDTKTIEWILKEDARLTALTERESYETVWPMCEALIRCIKECSSLMTASDRKMLRGILLFWATYRYRNTGEFTSPENI